MEPEEVVEASTFEIYKRHLYRYMQRKGLARLV